MKSTDIPVGHRFGLWVVTGSPRIVKRTTARGTNYVLLYPCKCDCGTIREVRAFKLLSNSTSCGCNRIVKITAHSTKHGYNRKGKRLRLYRVWDGMIQRCGNANHESFPDYGGSGILVCDEWKDFTAFMGWAIENGYDDSLEIDRIKNNEGYKPTNCRWVTSSGNKINRKVTVFIEAFGEKKCLTEWAKDSRCQVSPGQISHRIRKMGMTAEQAIVTPRASRRGARKFVGHHCT